jgi:hypothetical protein
MLAANGTAADVVVPLFGDCAELGKRLLKLSILDGRTLPQCRGGRQDSQKRTRHVGVVACPLFGSSRGPRRTLGCACRRATPAKTCPRNCFCVTELPLLYIWQHAARIRHVNGAAQVPPSAKQERVRLSERVQAGLSRARAPKVSGRRRADMRPERVLRLRSPIVNLPDRSGNGCQRDDEQRILAVSAPVR